jgi:release factor glutamine methyltransferase
MPSERAKPLLDRASARLKAAGCETPGLDARLLLQHVTGLSREDIILGPDREVSEAESARFDSLVWRRESREPVSRILGEREFYGRVFRVTPDVLDPRPDTETLVTRAIEVLPPAGNLLDLGTGTGAIILTILAERPRSRGTAVDISSAALLVAAGNARALGVEERLRLHQGSWFDGLSGTFDLIVSNPPYIPTADISGLSPDVRNFDPALALVGGDDGLDPYRSIASGAARHLAAQGRVLVEIGAGQEKDVEAIFAREGFQAAGRHRDLGQHVRCLEFISSP